MSFTYSKVLLVERQHFFGQNIKQVFFRSFYAAISFSRFASESAANSRGDIYPSLA